MNPMKSAYKEDQLATRRKAKTKVTGVELRGDETAAELYNLYMKSRQGNDSNLTATLRNIWTAQYHKEKDLKVKQA